MSTGEKILAKKTENAVSRRTLLIGGVATVLILPSKWTKPVIDTIITPAHAQASAPATTGGTTTTAGTTGGTTTTAATTGGTTTTAGTTGGTTTPAPTTTP